jgi:rhodanese-related sulfurtransferase
MIITAARVKQTSRVRATTYPHFIKCGYAQNEPQAQHFRPAVLISAHLHTPRLCSMFKQLREWWIMKRYVELISLERLLEMRENGEEFKLVEVLPEPSYKEGHLPDAINIPVESLETEAPRLLGKHDKVVLYCSNFTCTASTRGARTLAEMGYKHALTLRAGKDGWKAAGFPLAA